MYQELQEDKEENELTSDQQEKEDRAACADILMSMNKHQPMIVVVQLAPFSETTAPLDGPMNTSKQHTTTRGD